MKKTSDKKSVPIYTESSEPQVLYPQKTSPWKRIVPAAAAAAALAVAIPVGVNTLGKKAEVAAPATSVETPSELPSEISQPDTEIPEPKKEFDGIAALRQYFEDESARLNGGNAPAVMEADELSEYYRKLDLTAENNGLTIRLDGVLDTGSGSMYAVFGYETDSDDLEGVVCHGILKNGDSAMEHKWLSGIYKPTSAGSGVIVAEMSNIYYDNPQSELTQFSKLMLAFEPEYAAEPAEAEDHVIYPPQDPSEEEQADEALNKLNTKCVAFEVPANFNELPAIDAVSADDPDFSVKITPFTCWIENSPTELDTFGFSGTIKAELSDGSACFARAVPYGTVNDIGVRTTLYGFWSVPVNIDDIVRVECTVSSEYDAERTITLYEAESPEENGCVEAIRAFIEENRDSYAAVMPNIALGTVSAEDIERYVMPLNIVRSKDGLTVTVKGVMDAGNGFVYVAYDYEYDGDEDCDYVEVKLNMDGEYSFTAIGSGANKENGFAVKEKLNGMYVMAIRPSDGSYDAGSVSLKLSFVPITSEHICMWEPASSKPVGINIDVPTHYVGLPKLEVSTSAESGIDATLAVYPCGAALTQKLPTENNTKGVMLITLKDGTQTVGQGQVSSELTDENGEEYEKIVYLFTSPIYPDDIERIALADFDGLSDPIERAVIYTAE